MKLMRLEEAATRALLLITLSVVIALAPAPAWAQQAPRTLQGQVVDGRTSSPLAGVVVRVHDRMVRTDGEGRFTFVGVPDTALVHFDRIGYRAERIRVTSLGGTVALEPEPVLLDAVVVTTPQQNALAVGTALSVASVDAEAMHSGAHASVADALDGIEGVSVARVGSWGSRLYLRGLGDDRITVLVDGIKVNQACAFGMDQGVATIDPATVERIEILSGPGSALFGSGNIGGVVNVITKKPASSGAFTGEVRVGATTGTPGGSIGATLGARRGNVDVTLALDASDYDDYRTPHGTVEGSSLSQATGDLTIGWSPSTTHRLTLRSQVYEGRDIGWPSMAGASIPRESRRNVSLDWGAQLGAGILDGISARAYVQRLDHDMLVEMTMGGAMPMTMRTEQQSYSTTSGARVQLRLVPAPDVHLDLGAEVTNWAAENSRWTEQSGAMGSNRFEFRTWPGVDILDAGLFAQGEIPLLDRLVATLGGRIDHVVRQADGAPTTRDWIGSGNAGLRLTLPHGLGARVSVGYGYRIPNPTELYGLALKPDGFVYRGNAELDTETNRNVEASLTLDRTRLSASATVFRTDLKGLITPVLAEDEVIVGKPVRSYANLADSRLTGASGSFQWRPLQTLTLSGTASYTHGEDLATGRPLAAIPPLQGSLSARLHDDADRWIAVETLAAARQERVASHAGEVETPGYGVFNLSAGFRIRGLETTLGVDNLLDRAYRAHLDPVRLLRPGRSFFVRLSHRLGESDEGR